MMNLAVKACGFLLFFGVAFHSLANTAPQIISNPIVNVELGTSYNYRLQASDNEFEAVTWRIKPGTSLPSWLTLTQSSEAVVSTLAGTGTTGYRDGPGPLAIFNIPVDVVQDSKGNFFITDSENHLIRKVSPTGQVSTFAGSTQGLANGTGSEAKFNTPHHLVIDANDNLFVTDRNNYQIRKITPQGHVTTFAGSTRGHADGAALTAQFTDPLNIAFDNNGNLFVTDSTRIRKIATEGQVTTFAGSDTRGIVDATGVNAQFFGLKGIAVDPQNNIYVADIRPITGSSRYLIRKITPQAVVTTVSGSDYGTRDGSADQALFQRPYGIAIDKLGDIYITDGDSDRIRKIDRLNQVSTVAGSRFGNSDGPGSQAEFASPAGIFASNSRELFVMDQFLLRKIALPGFNLTGNPGVDDIGVSPEICLQALDVNNAVTEQCFSITVVANSVPTITGLPSAFNVYNNATTALDLSAVNLVTADMDAEVSLRFEVDRGRWFNVLPGAGVTYSSNGVREFTLTGSATNLVNFLDNEGVVSFQHSAASDGSAPIALSVTSSSGTKSSQPVNSVLSVVLNSDTVLSGLPASFTVPEGSGSAVDLSSLTVTDNDNAYLTLRLAVSSGVIYVPDIDKIKSQGGFLFNGGNLIEILALPSQLNRILQQPGVIAIRGVKDDLATRTLTVKTYERNDITRESNSLSASVSISAVNDKPTVTFGGPQIFDFSTGAIQQDGSYVQTVDGVTMTISSAQLTLTNPNFPFTGNVVADGFFNGQSLEVRGSLSNNQSLEFSFSEPVAINQLSHFDPSSFSGNWLFNVVNGSGSKFVFPAEGRKFDAGFAPYDWTSVNQLKMTGQDITSIALYLDNLRFAKATLADLSFNENTPGNLDLSSMVLADPDSSNVTLTLSLSVGSFGAQVASGASVGAGVTVTRVSDTAIQLSGSVADLNTYFDTASNITYQGPLNTFGDNAATLTISANDGSGDVTLTVVNIDIADVNFAPVISGTPATSINEDQTYSFTPVVSDSDGDTLSFSLTGAPSWLSINSSTGVVSGIPRMTDIGTTSNIVLTVSDGNLSTSLPAFSITVLEVNDAPVVTSTAVVSATQSGVYNYRLLATDEEGSAVTWRVKSGTTLPDWLTLEQRTEASVSTLAGSSQGYMDGQGIAAQFNKPRDVAFDAAGDLYVADSYNVRLRKITASAQVSTFAGSVFTSGLPRFFADGIWASAGFGNLKALAFTNNDLVVANSGFRSVNKVSQNSVVDTLARNLGLQSASQQLALLKPAGVAVDSSGNIFIASDESHIIQKLTPAGELSTFAGSVQGATDGQGSSAQFNSPQGLAFDSQGNLLVADTQNHRIRKIDANGTVTTLAGSTQGQVDGIGIGARFSSPVGLAVDADNNVFVGDSSNHAIRKISPTGAVSTFAGSGGGAAGAGSADGALSTAQFTFPAGLTISPAGDLYIADEGNHKIRVIHMPGTLLTGTPPQSAVNTNPEICLEALDAQGTTTEHCFTVAVGAANSKPQVSLQTSSLLATEDTESTLDLSSLSVSDGDPNDVIRFAVNVAEGTLRLPMGNSGNVQVSGSGRSIIALVGTIADINSYLNTTGAITYVPVANNDGSVTVQFSAYDGQEVSDILVSSINIQGVDDATTLSFSYDSVFEMDVGSISQDTSTSAYNYTETVNGVTLRIVSSDTLTKSSVTSSYLDGSNISSTLAASTEILSFSEAIDVRSVTVGNDNSLVTPPTEGIEVVVLSTEGTGIPVNSSISGLGKLSPQGWTGITNLVLSGGSNIQAAIFDDIEFSIRTTSPRNDLSVTEDTNDPLDLSFLQFEDIDSTTITVTLTLNTGSFIIPPADGSGVGSGVVATRANDKVVSLSGSPNDINRYLDNTYHLYYRGQRNLFGDNVDTLTVTVIGTGTLATLNIDITGTPDIPELTGIPPQTAFVGQQYSFTPGANDPDGGQLSFNINNAPAWLSVDASTGTLSGTPTAEYLGSTTEDITYIARNIGGITITLFSIKVELNQAPVVHSSAVTNAFGTTNYQYRLLASDPEGRAVTWRVKPGTSLPSWLSLEQRGENTLTTLAGFTRGTLDAVGTAARFWNPVDLAVDAQGNVYVSDNNDRLEVGDSVRKIAPSGRVSTVVNGGSWQFRASGFGLNNQQELLFAGCCNAIGGLHRVTPQGALSRKIDAGFTYPELTAESDMLTSPQDVAVDSAGNLYITDSFRHRIYKVTPQGQASVLAGSVRGFADGTGDSAQFFIPKGITIDASGNLYVADAGNHRIRKITSAGVVTTIAGGESGYVDGSVSDARFSSPDGIAVDVSGIVYVAESAAQRVRKIGTDNTVTTINDNNIKPNAVAVGPNGIIYLAETITTGTQTSEIKMLTPPGFYLAGTPSAADQGTTREVCVEAVDADGGIIEQCFTLSVGNDNSRAIITSAPVPQQITEDTPQTLDFTNVGVNDDDAVLKLTLTANSGILTPAVQAQGVIVQSNASLISDPAVSSSQPLSIVELIGSIQAINSFMATPGAILFTPARNHTDEVVISFATYDGYQRGYTAATGIAITPVDDASKITFLSDANFELDSGNIEDRSTQVELASGGTLTIPNFVYSESVGNVTLSLSSPAKLEKTTFAERELDGSNIAVSEASKLEVIEFSQPVDIRSFVIENNDRITGSRSTSVNATVIGHNGDFSGQPDVSGSGKFRPEGWYGVSSIRLSPGSVQDYAAIFDDIEISTLSDTVADLNVNHRENTVIDISKLRITDIDSNTVSIKLTLASGTFGIARGDNAFNVVGVTVSLIDQRTIVLTGSPSGVSFYLNNTPDITYQSGENVIGDNADTLTITSENSNTGVDTIAVINIDVAIDNNPPVISGTPANSVLEDSTYSFVPVVSDEDGDVLSFSLTGAPAWLSLNATTGALTGIPDNRDVGTYSNIVLSVTDGTASVSLPAFAITVINVNDPPVIGGFPAASVNEGEFYQFTPSAFDFEGNTLTFSGGNIPGWASFDRTSGKLSGTPQRGDVGTHSGITISVSDGYAQDVLGPFSINVISTNEAPQIKGTPVTDTIVGERYSFAPSASDTNGDELTFDIANAPSWANFNTATGELSGTPARVDVGTTSDIVISVSDGEFSDSLPSFSLTVTDINVAPVIEQGESITVTMSEDGTPNAFALSLSATDENGDDLSWSASAAQSGIASVDGTGIVSYVPGQNVNGTDSFSVTVSDGSESDRIFVNVTIQAINDAPVISGAPITRVSFEDVYSFVPGASDVDSDNLSFSIENQPAWSQFDSATGTLSGSPTSNDVAIFEGIVISVSDGALSTRLPAFSIEVFDPSINVAPTAENVSVRGNEDEILEITLLGQDDNNDSLTYSVITGPTNGNVTVNGNVASYTPNTDYNGEDSFTYISNDNALDSEPATVSISIAAVNDAPEISGEPATRVLTDQEYSFQPQAFDAENDSLTFSVDNAPGWLNFDSQSGLLSGTPTLEQIGVFENIVLTVSDGELNTSLAAFSIEVVDANANKAPVAQDLSVVTDEDVLLEITPVASDADSDPLTFVVQQTPALGTVTEQNGLLLYTPQANIGGVQDSFTYVASDGVADSNEATITIDIVAINDTPIISGTPISVAKVNQQYQFEPVASDIEDDTLTFTIVNQPRWADFDQNTGVLAGIPGVSDSGTFNEVTISVSDGEATATLTPFNIDVLVNNEPIISGTSVDSVEVGRVYSFTPQTSDEDGDTLQFSIVNAPSWATFDAATGSLTGTPGVVDVGVTSNIVISVTDGIASVALTAFDLEVCEVCGNVTPVINGLPATTVVEGNAYSFTPSASDSNDDTLTFSIGNQPTWTSFDPETGTITGVPQFADVGIYSDITISVSDGEFSASLAAFTLTVAELNDTPVISGTPATSVFHGQEYLFTPTASDAEGATLTFSIENQPQWAAFNPRTGTLRGTPVAASVGSYADIVINVTDGNTRSSLPPFSIEVLAQNTAPQISGSPRTGITQGEAYSFTPQASDADGDALSFSASGLPGWLSIDTVTGTLSGTPQSEDVGNTGNIVLSVSDEQQTTSLAAFSIVVTAANTAPVVINSTINVDEDSQVAFFPQASDADGDALQFTVRQAPQNGNLVTTGDSWIYTPNENFTGTDSLVFSAGDGELNSESGTVTIAVNSVNDVPVAVDDVFTLQQTDSGVYSLDVLANDSDVDITTASDSLIIQGADADFASVTIVNNQLEFNPGSSFVGSVGLVYALRDTEGATDQAGVTLTIEPSAGAEPPLINAPADIEVNSSGLFTAVELGVATATDFAGNSLPVSLVDNRTSFAPGRHTVFWQAEDSFGTMATAPQTVTVLPLVSISQDQTVSEGSRVLVDVILNGDAPQYPYTVGYTVSGSTETGVDHNASDGSVTFNSGREASIAIDIFNDEVAEGAETLIVSLDANFNLGTKRQSVVTVSESNIAPEVRLQVTQNSENRLTVARDDAQVIVSATIFDANPQDTVLLEWSSLTLTNVSTEEQRFVFNPNEVSAGIHQITLFASDNGSPVLSNSADVFIEVVDTLVVLSATEDTDGDLIPDAQEGFADSDGDGIPDYLDAINDCNVVPEQAANQSEFLVESEPGVCLRQGVVSALNASNGLGVLPGSGNNTVNRVARINRANRSIAVNSNLPEDPEAINVGGIFDFILYDLADGIGNIVLPQRQPIPANAVYRKYRTDIQQWVFFASDENNQIFSANGARGVCPPPGSDDWTPGLSEGDWCVQLQLEDGGPNDDDGIHNGSIMDPGGVAVILSNNQLPVAQNDAVAMPWNTSLEISALDNDSDLDGDSLMITNAQGRFGLVSITPEQTILYTPNQNYAGNDVVDYGVSDGNGGIASAQISITISGNRAPGALPDSAQTDDRTVIEIDVLLNDIDVDGDELRITRASAETGAANITDENTLLYTPQSGFDGLDIISYEVADPDGATAVSTVSVVVDGNQAPQAVDDSVTTGFETAVTFAVLSNDMDINGDELTIVDAIANSGDVVINDDNTLTFTPEPGFSGTVEVRYTISDGSLTSQAILTVTVNQQVVPPVETADSGSGGSSGLLSLLLLSMICWRRKVEIMRCLRHYNH